MVKIFIYDTPVCEDGSIIFYTNFITMEQKDKAWVVNATEAINRTCDAIYREYKSIIDSFNQHIIDKCSKRKHEIVYKTDNPETSKDLHYFYGCLGYILEVEEVPQYKDGIEYTIYKLKLMW